MIFPATILFSFDPDKLPHKITELLSATGNELNNHNPDIFVVDDQTGWGIDTIRQLKKFFGQKPLTHSSSWAIIYQADNLTPEAQNALLKTLEEPQDNQYLLLITNQTTNLLPTILSRCQLIKSNFQTPATSAAKMVPLADIRQNLTQTDAVNLTKDTALSYFQNQINLYQQDLIKHPSPTTANIIKKLALAAAMIKANVDPKSALDYFLLS